MNEKQKLAMEWYKKEAELTTKAEEAVKREKRLMAKMKKQVYTGLVCRAAKQVLCVVTTPVTAGDEFGEGKGGWNSRG